MKSIYLLLLFFYVLGCKAQQVFPLNTDFMTIPNNSYLKDINNELSPYVGIYKANYQNKEITLYITKEDHLLISTSGTRTYYQDVLHIKYNIKNALTGTTLQDNQNPINPKVNKLISMGTNTLDDNSLDVSYSGTNCGIGWGRITLKKINPTQISWNAYFNSSLLTTDDCSLSLDRTVYLPNTENLLFNKQ